MILKEKQRKALFEVVCMGQNSGIGLRPSRNERKAAQAAWKVLDEHGALPKTDAKEQGES